MSEAGRVHELRVPREALDRLDRIGGSGGDGSGIEARLARLEAHLERAQIDLHGLVVEAKDTRERLIKIEERVAHLPQKGFIVSTVLAALAVIAALITFQDAIRAIVNSAGSG